MLHNDESDFPLELIELERLQAGRNLLGFSAGVDSTALFFLLLERSIPFDIALVNYHTRAQSSAEESHAKALAARYNKRCFTLSYPLTGANFEHRAREVRYRFFEATIRREGYARLLLAHQLNDRLEWLLMQLSRGSSLGTLLGFSPVESRGEWEIIRPLSHTPKSALYAYLKARKIPYFEDESNHEPRFWRNRLRPLSDALLEESPRGIQTSLTLLHEEKLALYGEDRRVKIKALRYFEAYEEARENLHFIDLSLKELGYVMSQGQRRELVKSEFSAILGGQWAVDSLRGKIFIAPYIRAPLPKRERERLRQAGIAPKVRPYCFKEGIVSL